jgi:hypothetical protein
MPAPHPPEFRRRAVELARQGVKPVSITSGLATPIHHFRGRKQDHQIRDFRPLLMSLKSGKRKDEFVALKQQ